MSKNLPTQQQTIVIQAQPGNSGLGTAGLIFSILGWFTCGLLCPLGALLSFFGLFSRGSKSYAIAGLIVGFPGVIFLMFFGFGILAALLGLGAVATVKLQPRVTEQNRPTTTETPTTETTTTETPAITPAVDEPPLVPVPPDYVMREWSAKTGKFKTSAKFVARDGNNITIEKEDGKQVTIALDKLSDEDNQYVMALEERR